MSEHIAPGPPPHASQPPPPVSRYGRGGAEGPACPECGAKRITPAAVPCWLCQELLPPLDGAAPAGSLRGRDDSPAFIVLGVLIILIVLALAAEAPGLIVVFALVATPAIIRSIVVSRRAAGAGQPLSGTATMGAFLGALGSVALVGAAAGVAFFVTCFAVCWAGLAATPRDQSFDSLFILSVGAGIVPGIVIFVWLIRYFWSRRRT